MAIINRRDPSYVHDCPLKLRAYRALRRLNERCIYNKTSQYYKNYYGRGIRVCKEWQAWCKAKSYKNKKLAEAL